MCGLFTSNKFKQDNSKAIDIPFWSGHKGACILRSYITQVTKLTIDKCAQVGINGIHKPCQPKIRNLRLIVIIDQYALGTNVPMKNAGIATVMKPCQSSSSPNGNF
ncbi:hypothetical protein PAHAL_8G066100 [Panicum hallii]|uniref:Uncharacterized protein n=1 Tax=Panicum hallii TaxID=206008 RepID=A0A2T8I7Y2_9POAL|nr:hypothetical protein PAHAL_8G066100 [Panicum hallii]